VESVPALLVSIGAPRLREIGLEVPGREIPQPEHLYGEIEPWLHRYPALDPASFRRALEAAVKDR